jgi:putative SOS response-associated peptidase YedK
LINGKEPCRWGLVPSYTKHGDKLDHYKMFNARAETVNVKGVFKRLLPSKRCVVLLNGFYEWKKEAGGKKQPHFISFGEDDVLQMAGLYDTYTGEHPLTMVSQTGLGAPPLPQPVNSSS